MSIGARLRAGLVTRDDAAKAVSIIVRHHYTWAGAAIGAVVLAYVVGSLVPVPGPTWLQADASFCMLG